MKFGMQDKLVGIVSKVKAVVNNTKTKAKFVGTLEFDWSEVTLQQVLDAFAAPDRKITWANTHRDKIGEYRNKKVVHVKVSPPGTRVSIAAPMTDKAVIKHVETEMDADSAIAMLERIIASKKA